MISRITLETMRTPGEYFIQNAGVANFIMLALILISGFVMLYFAQFIAPKK